MMYEWNVKLCRYNIHLDKHSLVSLVQILTNFMELRHSCEAASCAATQEISNISGNQKVHYRIHKSPSSVPVLGQINPLHTIPSSLHPSSILILSTHLHLGLSSGFFSSGFPNNVLHALISPFVLHALPISSSLTWSFYLYLEKSTSYEAPHYAVLSNLLSLHFYSIQIRSSASFSQTPLVCVPPLMSETKFYTRTEQQAKL
jgi:hypothetical protein